MLNHIDMNISFHVKPFDHQYRRHRCRRQLIMTSEQILVLWQKTVVRLNRMIKLCFLLLLTLASKLILQCIRHRHSTCHMSRYRVYENHDQLRNFLQFFVFVKLYEIRIEEICCYRYLDHSSPYQKCNLKLCFIMLHKTINELQFVYDTNLLKMMKDSVSF